MSNTYYAFRCCNAKINPTDLAGTGQFNQERDGALVLVRTDTKRMGTPIVLTGWHHTYEEQPVGTKIRVIGDQTRGVSGVYLVVGAVDYRDQSGHVGNVPDRMLKHYVMK